MIGSAETSRTGTDNDAFHVRHCARRAQRIDVRSGFCRLRHQPGGRFLRAARGIEQRVHFFCGRIPRSRCDDCAHFLDFLRALFHRLEQRCFARRDELLRIGGDVHNIAIQIDHVGHRRADNRKFGRHVFKRLGRTDEPRSLIQRKRQQAHIPSRQKMRQGLVRLLSKIMDIRALRQHRGIDLDERDAFRNDKGHNR